jgi:hypothetical protein
MRVIHCLKTARCCMIDLLDAKVHPAGVSFVCTDLHSGWFVDGCCPQ